MGRTDLFLRELQVRADRLGDEGREREPREAVAHRASAPPTSCRGGRLTMQPRSLAKTWPGETIVSGHEHLLKRHDIQVEVPRVGTAQVEHRQRRALPVLRVHAQSRERLP